MAERDDVGREQIGSLRRDLDAVSLEIQRTPGGLRHRMHSVENRLTAQALDHEVLKDHEDRLKAIEGFQNRMMGVMIVGGLLVPPVTAALVKVIG